MQNSTEISRDFKAGETIQFLTDMSPFFVIATTITSLAVIFLIDITYLTAVFFPKMSYVGYVVGFLVPSGIMVARLGFGLLGASDISKGAWISGLIGLSGTFAIAIFEHSALTHIAEVWNMPDQIGLFQFMVWLAVGAELRLMMTLGNENNLLNSFFKKKAANEPNPNVEGNGKTEKEWDFNYNMKGKPV